MHSQLFFICQTTDIAHLLCDNVTADHLRDSFVGRSLATV